MPFDPISYDLASKKIPPVLKDLDMNGKRILKLGGLLPKTDNTYDIGDLKLRWRSLCAVNVYTGDLNFEEKVCEVCGQPFLKDDELVLKVKEVDDYTRTVPVHLKCSQAYKELDERLKLCGD